MMNIQYIEDKLNNACARLAECRMIARTCPNDNINQELIEDYEEEVGYWVKMKQELGEAA